MNARGPRARAMLRLARCVAAIASCFFFGASCQEHTLEAPSEAPKAREPSPNASIQPAPFEEAEALFSGALDDAGAADAGAAMSSAESPPTPLREDLALATDVLEEREILGNELEGVFVWHDVPSPLAVPELDVVTLGALREKTALTMRIHVTTADRASFVLASPAFPLGQGTELRARRDRYGHLLLWPNGKSYRPTPPGALRAVLGERRTDVVSLVAGASELKSRGKILGFPTTITLVSSPFGAMELEQAEIPGLARSGVLLCRFLVELVGVEPSLLACDDKRAPLHAEYRWKDGGKLSFVVRKLGRRRQYEVEEVAAPPANAQFAPGLLPPAPQQRLEPDDLVRLRKQAVAPTAESGKSHVPQGLVAGNNTPILSALLVDGIPVAWLAPGEERLVAGLRRGRYAIAFRDFLGQNLIPARPTGVPGHIAAGEAPEATTPGQ